MQFMDRKQTEILNKLVYIADGDTRLVEDAIRACSSPDGPAPLKDVIDYIETHRGGGNRREVAYM
jgi:hypothetical protein